MFQNLSKCVLASLNPIKAIKSDMDPSIPTSPPQYITTQAGVNYNRHLLGTNKCEMKFVPYLCILLQHSQRHISKITFCQSAWIVLEQIPASSIAFANNQA